MEKVTKAIKDIVIILLILAIVWFSVSFVTNLNNIKTTIAESLGIGTTNVNAFEGADTNYNGGLTRTEITKQKENDDCPTHNDVNDTIYIQDYGNVVVFYKKVIEDNKTKYPNILFIKTDEGLKFDGAFNIHGECYAGWFGAGYSFKVWQQNDKIPSFSKSTIMIFDNPGDNFCEQIGFSGFITRIVKCFGNLNERIAQTQNYIIKSIYPYFLSFCEDNIEIIQDKGTESGDFNFFYDYLYRCSQSYDYGTKTNDEKITSGTCCVDVSKLTVYPLPNELKTTYPIPDTDPQEYFGVYNCKTFLTCNYFDCLPKLDYSNKKQIVDGVADDPIEKKDIEVEALSNIEISLIPGGDYLNSTIRSIVEQSPVEITFYKNKELTNTVVFDENNFINSVGKVVSGFKKDTYTYEISSGQLLFDSYSGSITITESSSIRIKYTYSNGKVFANFSISPISNDIDYSLIDLQQYPVLIILNNNSKTYQLRFESLDSINKKQSLVIPLGNYTYSILSEKLIFGSTTGNIKLTPQNRNFDFSFALVYNRSDLDFSVIVKTTASSTDRIIYLSGDSNSVALLGRKLNCQNYFVNISIYDESGSLIETLNHSHSGQGTCGESFTCTNLVNNEEYIVQMTYANGKDVSQTNYVEYQSSTFSFTYTTKTQFTFAYSCTEID